MRNRRMILPLEPATLYARADTVMTIKTAFPPSVAPDTRLLILGSLPGEESLRQGRYYAHPTNAFWWLVGEVVGEPLAALDYEYRLERLKAHRIGLWDVIATARRQGSLDQAIREAELRDLGAFVRSLPELRAVAFNGQTSAKHGRRQLAGVEGLTLVDLPSSSAAHAGMSREAKREAWVELRRFL
jgi:TDG/mug DNA glycosylase family protein